MLQKLKLGGTKIMGMAASQARYLALTARKSNIEFQGQQINQQRTTLANASSAYNSQLLNVKVPTAPSSADFTKTVYKMSMNGNTCTISSSGISYDETTDTYTVPYSYDSTVTQAQNAGTRSFKGSYTDGFTAANGNTLTKVSKATTAGAAALTRLYEDIGFPQFTLKYTDGTAEKSATLSKVDTSNASTLSALQAGVGSAYDSNKTYYSYSTVVGNTTTTYYVDSTQLANAVGTTSTVDSTITPYTGGGPAGATADIRETEFYSFTSSQGTTYVLASDANKSATTAEGSDANVSTYYINDDAVVTKKGELSKASILWSDSGRISSITDKAGNEYKLSTTTTTDTNAYNEAMNEYAYQRQVYDKTMNDINAKLDIVQQQDKSLELQLTQLDTEQKAVSTEEEAVKKVLEKNAEAFKTFA